MNSRLLLVVLVIGLCAAAQSSEIGAWQAQSAPSTNGGEQSLPAPASGTRPSAQVGYLNDLPDSSALLPPPPGPSSAAFALDEAVNRHDLALRGTPRWELAQEDADLDFPQAAGTFSCSLNAPITEKDTPHLYALLQKTLGDAGNSTGKAKSLYKRKRPFLLNKQPTCTPNDEGWLRKNGSYPSGHAATGWAWALILAELSPDRADAILARGRAFGESRLVCNVHWQSDVDEGRFMGSSTVATLHSDSAFRADMDKAKVEIATVRAKGMKPIRDCAKEAAELTYKSSSLPRIK